jgi:hypothetical protein
MVRLVPARVSTPVLDANVSLDDAKSSLGDAKRSVSGVAPPRLGWRTLQRCKSCES